MDEGSTVTADEYLPRGFAAKGAGVRESKFGEMEGAKERGLLSGIGMRAGRKPMVDSFADRNEDEAELFQAEAAALRLRGAPKLLDETLRQPRN